MSKKQKKSRLKGASSLEERLRAAIKNNATELNLSNLNLPELPESILQLNQLELLILDNNQLTELPEFITNFKQLRGLSIENNQLEELPKAIGQLEQLTHLSAGSNRLKKLPESIGQLAHLQILSVSENQLQTLPDSIWQLKQLTHVSILANRITELSGSISQLTQLKSLFISVNPIQGLPQSLNYLTQLEALGLSSLRLKEVPEFVSLQPHLVNLFLSDNELKEIPEFICQQPWLQQLYLNNNHLTEIPESIGQLTLLQELVLSYNQLTKLPESLRNITTLKKLLLHGNEALGVPIEVLGKDEIEGEDNFRQNRPKEILEYYFRARGSQRPLNEAKLILVGRGKVGKTSLVNRLVHDRFAKNEKKTEGIKITKWTLELDKDEEVSLNTWDFGGQEVMHATHQFFFSQRSLYLLVLNGREGAEDEDAEYWLKLIESFGDESPVIVVLNKIKEHAFDVNRRALQQKYPAIRDFIKTDCEDATGIEDLRRAIKRETGRLEHLRDPFPASWLAIKDRLSGMRKSYLSYEEYKRICARLGEPNPGAQELLTSYMHSLGIALNYKDDPRLQDTHVLNPQWVTGGIYKIINSETLEKQKGEIWLNNLADILDRRIYPVRMHRFLIDLMKKFELCFSFPDDECHYLIPELLDKQEPQEAAAFKWEECLNFQYHYGVLPEGLVPRFIVRTHVLSQDLPRWRTGVILKFESCRALVRADLRDKKVFVSVLGPPHDRRRLLAIIRADFERIHRDIRNLQPQEIVPLPARPDAGVGYQELLVMEGSGLKEFPKVIDGKVIQVNVNELLNGVDLQGARGKQVIIDRQVNSVRLFYSYSHKDEQLRNELETHLKLLQRRGLVETWNDRNIDAGDDWKRRIDENLETADIILLLISSDFISSDYCYEKEMKRALERNDEGQAQVIPIIVRDVNWSAAPLARLQALPKDGVAVTTWPNKDSAWRNVSEGIERVVEKMRKRKGGQI